MAKIVPIGLIYATEEIAVPEVDVNKPATQEDKVFIPVPIAAI